ncbi:LysR family transcriptional regulator [Microbacterium sp. No. 7]|uniref:LysR family transcriptional regulator n=1 Tax=Microbacterium sp. No. 7 TaxID=1714373 RepID=UPI00300A44A3
MSRDRLAELLPHLPLLDALGDDEHVTRAAEALGVPQPTVSRALRQLESRLGVALVARDGRGIRLTDAARRMLPGVRVALRAAQDALDSLDDARSTVVLAFQNSLGENLVPRLVRRLREERPDIRVQLWQGARDGCLAELDSGRTDLAIVSGAAATHPSGETLHLYDEPLVVVVPEGAPARDGRAGHARGRRRRDARHAQAGVRTAPHARAALRRRGRAARHRLRG